MLVPDIQEGEMEKLIGLLPLQLARLAGLVKSVAPVPMASGSRQWVLRIEGRGFTRVLKDDILVAPNLIRPAGWHRPRARTFLSKAHARNVARNLGLLPNVADESWPPRVVKRRSGR